MAVQNEPKSYAEIMAEIKALQQQADSVRENEIRSLIDTMKNLIAERGFTPSDLGITFYRAPRPRATLASVPKRKDGPVIHPGNYRDPHTGDVKRVGTRGRKPMWLVALRTQEEVDSYRVAD